MTVTNADDTATDRATINPSTGMLTANKAGQVKVTATVAADNTYSSSTIRHTLTISLQNPNLSFTASPTRLRPGQTTQFSVTRDGTGVITWSIVENGASATIDPATGLVTASATAETITVQASVAETATHASQTLTVSVTVTDKVDFDGDGLIEIHDLTMLHNIRYNLTGTSYKTAAAATGVTTGCPDAGCNGYELVSDLDFDTDGDGTTWSGDSTNGYTLDSGDSQAPYFITANGGWEPIGDCGANDECGESSNNDDSPFTATFEGNGFVIRNLAIRRNQPYYRSLWVHRQRNPSQPRPGARPWPTTPVALMVTLSPRLWAGWMVAPSPPATPPAQSMAGMEIIANVGGLVGYMQDGTLTASYATGTVNGGDGD